MLFLALVVAALAAVALRRGRDPAPPAVPTEPGSAAVRDSPAEPQAGSTGAGSAVDAPGLGRIPANEPRVPLEPRTAGDPGSPPDARREAPRVGGAPAREPAHAAEVREASGDLREVGFVAQAADVGTQKGVVAEVEREASGDLPPAPAAASGGSAERADVDGPVAPGDAARVWTTVSASTLQVGDALAIDVHVSAPSEIAHAPFHMRYDPRVLRFDRAEEGSFLGDDGRSTAFFAAADSTGRAVVVGLSRLGRVGGIRGDGRLCRLYFTAIGTGDAGLAFERAHLKDAANRPLGASFDATRVVVP